MPQMGSTLGSPWSCRALVLNVNWLGSSQPVEKQNDDESREFFAPTFSYCTHASMMRSPDVVQAVTLKSFLSFDYDHILEVNMEQCLK